MKLFFIFLLISIPCFAGYVAGSKANNCSRTDYTLMSACQDAEGEACYKVPGDSGECGIFKLQDLYGNVKYDEQSCEDQEGCQTLLAGKVCGVDRVAFINESYTEVYCVEVIGKELVVDEAVKTQKYAANAASAAFEAGIAMAQKLRACGERVMALMLVRNQPKGLSTAQVKALVNAYAPIKSLLESGSLLSAKEEILAVEADGVLVTAGDKTALSAEIDKCL